MKIILSVCQAESECGEAVKRGEARSRMCLEEAVDVGEKAVT